MVQIKNLLLLLGFVLMSACSMQPLIDASLPPAVPPSDTPQPLGVPASPTTIEPNERAVAVTTDSQLPVAAQSLLAQALVLRNEGNSTGAIARLERAVKIAPRSPLVYFELAQTYWQQVDEVKARVFAEKALSLAPSGQLAKDIRKLIAQLDY